MMTTSSTVPAEIGTFFKKVYGSEPEVNQVKKIPFIRYLDREFQL